MFGFGSVFGDILLGVGAGLIVASIWGRLFWKTTYERGKRAGRFEQLTEEQFLDCVRTIVAEIGVPRELMISIARMEYPDPWDPEL